MGTFDILNLRLNGYQFHVDLMAGKQKWTDPKVIAVFNLWKDLMPFHQTGAAGRIWQDAAQALVKKTAGMYLLGMFVSQQFKAVDDATLADLDFFPFPNLGTEFDAEKALDAPIDGFMIAAKSAAGQAGQDQTNAKAFVGFLGTGARAGHLRRRRPEQHRGRQGCGHLEVQRASAEGRSADRLRAEDHPVHGPRHAAGLRRRRTACRTSS